MSYQLFQNISIAKWKPSKYYHIDKGNIKNLFWSPLKLLMVKTERECATKSLSNSLERVNLLKMMLWRMWWLNWGGEWEGSFLIFWKNSWPTTASKKVHTKDKNYRHWKDEGMSDQLLTLGPMQILGNSIEGQVWFWNRIFNECW